MELKINRRPNHKPWWNAKLGKLRYNMYIAEKKWLSEIERNQLFKSDHCEYTLKEIM